MLVWPGPSASTSRAAALGLRKAIAYARNRRYPFLPFKRLVPRDFLRAAICTVRLPSSTNVPGHARK